MLEKVPGVAPARKCSTELGGSECASTCTSDEVWTKRLTSQTETEALCKFAKRMKSGAREDISPPVEAERPPAAAEYAATMLAGASAGCLARTFTYPMDTCKARIMVQKKAAPGTVVVSQALRKEISTIVRKEGFGGFYRGFTFAFFGSIPAGMLYFTFYEFARDTLERHGASSAVTALVGGFFAEALSCVLWVPLDVLKERMQTQTVLAKQLYEGHSDVPNPARSGAPVTYQSSVVFARDIWRSEGFVGLYKGCVVATICI